MSTSTVVLATGEFERKQLKAAQQFFTAQGSLIGTTETMIDTVHAVTQNPAQRASLDTLLGQIAGKQAELAALLDSFLPPRSAKQVAYDLRRVKAGDEAENRLCDHRLYSFQKHGRICPCGTMMVDFGD
ncbi:MAG: hypothetical protein Q7S76_01520 [bacterium]|nr:hypothetical protein [bacterium]